MWIVPWDPFLMKKLLKSEVYGSRALFTGPTGLIKEAEKSTIYGYCSWKMAVRPLNACVAAEEKKKKKKEKKREET